jgi:predicted metal-dependent hydrolase
MRPHEGSRFARGVELLNHAEFYDAHEVLEDVWRTAQPPQRRFLQGLIQVAVAFHHRSHGNRIGFRSLLERAIGNLSLYPAEHAGVDLAALLENLAQWRAALDDGAPNPSLPYVKPLSRLDDRFLL